MSISKTKVGPNEVYMVGFTAGGVTFYKRGRGASVFGSYKLY